MEKTNVSEPIKRIQMTDLGEILNVGKDCETTDKLLAGMYPGYHEECGGMVATRRVSRDYNILRCEKCGLRVYFPSYVKTLGELRDSISKRLKIWVGGLGS